MKLESYKELTVWKKSIRLVEAIYLCTSELPREEIYGLTSQMRRAAVSIPSNIAEGSRRKNLNEYVQFLRIAYASAAELETQVIISKRLYSHIKCDEADTLLGEVQKMLNTLLQKLSNKKFLK